MTRIYTRSGDQGKTGLANGTRTAKSSPRIEALGAVDELNAHLGLLHTLIRDKPLAGVVTCIQHELFDLGAALAATTSTQNHRALLPDAVEALEQNIDALEQQLPPLTGFILPGGNTASAQAHISRTICRRAERRVFRLAESEAVPEVIPCYLNRLSDFLFVLARTLARTGERDRAETLWQAPGKRYR